MTLALSGQAITDIDFGNFIHTPLPDGSDYIYAFNGDDISYGDNFVTDPCILSLGDDDHLFDHAGNDVMFGQLRHDTYHFGPSTEANESDIVGELEDGGTNERFDEGFRDRLNFDGVPEKNFAGLTTESVTVDLSGSELTFLKPKIAEHTGAGMRSISTAADEQFEFFEQIIGGAQNDTLIANSRANLLDGRIGSDLLIGAAGDDTYVFTPGEAADNDQLVETSGNDTLDFSAIPGPVNVDLSHPLVIATYDPGQQVTTPSPGLFENAIGTGLQDILQGSAEANILLGTDDADTLRGLAGDDWLLGGAASDLYVFEDNWGEDEVWEFASGGDDDVLDFTAVTTPLTVTIGSNIDVTDGANTMHHPGLQSEHVLGGASAADTIVSGDGDNLWQIDGLNTGKLNGVTFTGIENLIGGNGNDTFVFLPGGSLSGGIDGGLGDDIFDFSLAGSVGGVIDGNAGHDSILGDDADRAWTIDGPDSGSAAGIGNFVGVEVLGGGAGTDTFTVGNGGTLMNGLVQGGGGNNTLVADNVATTFQLAAADAGTLSGTNQFSFTGISNLTGGTQDDTFDLGTGSLSGDIVGGDGKDQLIAADVPTEFIVTSADAGSATNLSGGFTQVESLTGAANDDTFVLAGGTLGGLITGGDGQDTFIGDAVENTFVVTGADVGTATGVTDGFTEVENLVGNTENDVLRIEGGSLTGQFDGDLGDDQIAGELNQASIFVVTGANAGGTDQVATFDNVETLTGGNQNDQFFIQNLPFAGTLDGTAGSNTLRGFLSSLAFNVTLPDEGNISGTTTFLNIGSLTGSIGDDTFTLVGTGTLSGIVDGSLGSDTLVAADVETDFELTGAGSGTMTGVASFQNIENLTGGTATDDFVLNGGTLDGTVDGGDGDDTFTADNVFNIFRIQQPNGGLATGIGEFINVESLIGNDQLDRFFIEGGTLGGSIDGDDGADTLSGDEVENTIVVDAANGGSITGITGGFANIESIAGSDLADNFTVTNTGSLDGFLYGVEGDDVFAITPADGTSSLVFGGLGQDTLTVEAGAGVPTDDLISNISVAPGGASITYFGVEAIVLICDTCPPPPPERSTDATLWEMRNIDDPVGAQPQDVGAYSSTQGMDYSFEWFLRQQFRRRQIRSDAVADVEDLDTIEIDWLESAETDEAVDALFEGEEDFLGRRFF